MIDCLYFIRSNKEYHDLMSFLLDGGDFSGISYLIFSEDVECSDGRVFHTLSGYLIAVNFLSHASDLQEKLTKIGLNPDSLVDLYKIVCEDDNPLTKATTITESAECIIFEKELEEFLSDNGFRFSDSSMLKIPEGSFKRAFKL